MSDACAFGEQIVCPPLSEFVQGEAFLGDFLALIGAWVAAGYVIVGRSVRERMRVIPYIFLVYRLLGGHPGDDGIFQRAAADRVQRGELYLADPAGIDSAVDRAFDIQLVPGILAGGICGGYLAWGADRDEYPGLPAAGRETGLGKADRGGYDPGRDRDCLIEAEKRDGEKSKIG